MTPNKNAYATLPPNANGNIEPFEIHISEQKLQDFKELLRLSPVAKDCYENQTAQQAQDFGITREWLVNAKWEWLNTFDWRKEEAHLNTIPHYKATIKDDDNKSYTLHFTALFSSKKNAIPIVRSHGWPSSFAEFQPVLSLLQSKYTPETLPYHIIVPSLPGYTFSDAPPLDRDWTIADSARLIHKLMLALGFAGGYVVQGGDIGAAISRTMAAMYTECRAMHLNYNQMFAPSDADSLSLTAFEERGLERYNDFSETGTAYGRMHGTRPSTIGHILSSSPLALLSWIGEKYLEWCDPSIPIPLHTILREASLYWFTECFATSIYPYREDYRKGIYKKGYFHGQEEWYVDKPFGYSYFPYELGPMPKAWVEKTGKLVWCRYHEEGGHYPALERPEALLADVEEFVGVAWKDQ